MPIQPGTRLGAYEVKNLIGHGAMGSVWLARHEDLDRTAAVKVMLALGDDEAAIGRFRREGRAIALLRHPNVVTVYDYGTYEGTPCPAVSPSPPQLSASPNPVPAGEPLTISGSGFATGDPLFVVIDSAGDCTNPTAGAKVYNTSSYTDPLAPEPSPVPDSIGPGNYLLRACNQRPGENPVNCVQVPLSVTAAASTARTQSRQQARQ